MAQLNDRAALLAAVRALREDVERFTDACEGRATERDDGDAWTCNDLIAHLTSWRLMTAARLEAALRGEELVMPWPAPLDEDDDDDLDEINRWFYEINRDKPLTEIRRESRETFERVERAIAALPERDLFTPNRFPWLAGSSLGPAVVQGMLDHHYQEHDSDIRG